MNHSLVHRAKRFSIVIYVLTSLGLMTELLLESHYEEFWQVLPLVVISLGLMILLAYQYWTISILKISNKIMVILLILTGCVGVFFHLKNNWGFELEIYPHLKGWELFRKTLTGAIPVLAPGALVILGLLGQLILLFERIKQSYYE